MRSKRELIERFIEEHLPLIGDSDDVGDEFLRYWEDEKVLALGRLCDDEGLDRVQFGALIEAYVFSDEAPLREEVFGCLGGRPSVFEALGIGERIIGKMKDFVNVFLRGMVG